MNKEYKQYIEIVMEDMASLEKTEDKDKYRRRFLEILDVVNDQGRVIGEAPRGLSHRLGLRHRTIYVMIVRDDGEILLQQRGGGIDTIFGRLDIAVAGHVKARENNLKLSACREMKEELGISPEEERVVLIGEYNRDAPLSMKKALERNRERRFLFEYVLTGEELSRLDDSFKKRQSKGEVVSISWFTVEKVIDAINKGKVADGLLTSFINYIGAKYGKGNNRP